MSIRLDKWLWAARFFKTRSIARAAIDGGKVHVNGQRSKPNKSIDIGMTLKIRQGYDEKTVIVTALAGQRRSAKEARELYQETAESIAGREKHAALRKLSKANLPPQTKPDKKQRRQLRELKRDK